MITAAAMASPPAAVCADTPNPAQPLPDNAQSREADALFDALLKDPKNVDLTFRYAEAAIKAGNIEAAISSLERLLLLNRNFPGIKLELARLYNRLHSYTMAKSYLAQAAKEPNADPNALASIQSAREEIETANSPSKISTNLLVGIRYQSNGSAEPAGSTIIAGGIPQTLSTIFIGKPAWDSFATGNVRHTYDFGNLSLESNLLAYYSKSLGHSTLDLAALEINSGPRFDVDIGATHLVSARPYVLANQVMLGERPFLQSIGTGLGVDRPITDTLSAAGFYEFRGEWFSAVPLSPNAEAMNGTVHSFGALLNWRVVEDADLGLGVSYAMTDDFASVGSNKGLVVHLSYLQLFKIPPNLGVGPLAVSGLLDRIYSRDDGPDPAFDPVRVPATNEWRYGGTVKLALSGNITANIHVVREIITSNVAASRSKNTQIILGCAFAY